MLADNSKFQITVDIYEEIDSSDLDFNFMFFETGKSEKLSDQIVPTPEIEESNNDDEKKKSLKITKLICQKTKMKYQHKMKSTIKLMVMLGRGLLPNTDLQKAENHKECQDLQTK